MPQLNLNFHEIPIPETHLWEQFDEEQKHTVLEILLSPLQGNAEWPVCSGPMTDPSKIKTSHLQRAPSFSFAIL